jgi:NAD(P)H dehydrogenase (quinone)
MKIFIVHAHPESESFNGAMTREATAAGSAARHDVLVSDLYAMRFDPISDRRNFKTVKDAKRFDQQDEEEYASERGGFASEVQAEMEKLAWCDTLIFQFPLWWMGMPAVLKGWVDRVLAAGFAYGGGRYFDRGVFGGKRAMCSVTVGGPRAAYSTNGIYGPIHSILFPIHHGILAFVGFSVIEPFVVFGPGRMNADQRRACLDDYRQRLLSLESTSTIPSLHTADYDKMVLKPTLHVCPAQSCLATTSA